MLTNLKTLHLGLNMFSGNMPPGISALSKLTYLDMSFNKGLLGPIPRSLTELAQLRFLSLGKNMFTGMIPPGMFALSKLEWLDLSNNPLTGTSPQSSYALSTLRLLDLSATALTGPFPSTIGNSKCPLRLEGETSMTTIANSTVALKYIRTPC